MAIKKTSVYENQSVTESDKPNLYPHVACKTVQNKAVEGFDFQLPYAYDFKRKRKREPVSKHLTITRIVRTERC
jgi:hypothetical protein